MMGDAAVIEFRSHLSRLQRQMIALLPKYCLSDRLLKQVRKIPLHLGWRNKAWVCMVKLQDYTRNGVKLKWSKCLSFICVRRSLELQTLTSEWVKIIDKNIVCQFIQQMFCSWGGDWVAFHQGLTSINHVITLINLQYLIPLISLIHWTGLKLKQLETQIIQALIK